MIIVDFVKGSQLHLGSSTFTKRFFYDRVHKHFCGIRICFFCMRRLHAEPDFFCKVSHSCMRDDLASSRGDALRFSRQKIVDSNLCVAFSLM